MSPFYIAYIKQKALIDEAISKSIKDTAEKMPSIATKIFRLF